MKKQKAIVNCENVKLYCLPKWYINCIIQSNKRRRKVKDSNQNIAKAVLKIRQDNKLSQEQFAEMVGVTRQAVSRWEMGVSVPNINTLILISEKFDIPVDEMLKSGDVVEKIDNNKTSFKKDRNYSIVFLTIGILGLISIPFEMSADDHNCTSHLVITAPVILVLTLFVWLCTGLIYISSLVLGLLSTVIALLGAAVIITYFPQNGVILLVIAFLISPMGLPLAAIWLLGKVQDLKFAIQDWMYG